MKIGGAPPQRRAVPKARPEPPPAPRPRVHLSSGDSFERAPLAGRVQALFHPTPPPAASTSRPRLTGGPSEPATFGPARPIPPGTVPSTGPDATPAEAAAYIQDQTRFYSQEDQVYMFGAMLSEHQEDPGWLHEFFGYLGAETSADLLNRSVGFDSRAYPLTRVVRFETIQNTLVTLHDAGALNQADMDALMAAWGPRLDPQLALMFGALAGGHEELQNLFVRSAVSYAATSPRREGAADVAAAAAWVLAETPVDNQLVLMQQIQEAGELAAFIDGATRGPSVAMTVGPTGSQDTMAYVGIVRLIDNLSRAHLREGHQDRLPISPSELTSLQRDVFLEAVEAFGDGRVAVWADNPLFRDGLSAIFVEHFALITRSILPAKNQPPSPDDPLFRGMRGLFEYTLFAVPTSAQSRQLAERLGQRLAEVSTALQSGMSDEALRSRYGLDRVDLTRYEGMVLGLVTGGLARATDRMRGDAHAVRQVLDVLGIVLQTAGGASLGLETFMSKVAYGLFAGRARGSVLDVVEQWLAERGISRLETAPDLARWIMDALPGIELSEFQEGFSTALGLTIDELVQRAARGELPVDDP